MRLVRWDRIDFVLRAVHADCAQVCIWMKTWPKLKEYLYLLMAIKTGSGRDREKKLQQQQESESTS